MSFIHNPDHDESRGDRKLRELERIYQSTGLSYDWTLLAIERQRQGLMWPAPPRSFCPGFRFMSESEIRNTLERAREYRHRVEVVWAPGYLMQYGKVWDWPEENVREDGNFSGLAPYWSKTRFFVGRSTGREPVLLLLPTRISSGGTSISASDFVYIRILTEDSRGRWYQRY